MRSFWLLVSLLSLPFVGLCSDGVRLLGELSSAMKSMGQYEVSFSLVVNGEEIPQKGYYLVDGERYILVLAGQKVYGDSSVRYTIDAQNREVVIESIDSSTPMIVSNPATAFSGLEDVFNVELLSQSEEITLRLTPKVKSAMVESSELVLDGESKRPLKVSYRADGEQVVVSILSLEPANESIPKLDKIEYPKEYEVIDIRR